MPELLLVGALADNDAGRRTVLPLGAAVLGAANSTYSPSRSPVGANAQSTPLPVKPLGSWAESQSLVKRKTPGGPESLTAVRRLSISR